MFRATPPATSDASNHFHNHVNYLEKGWAMFASDEPVNNTKEAEDWVVPDEWKEYLNEVFDYFGKGPPESNDNYPYRQEKLTTSLNSDGFPIMTTSPLSNEEALENLSKQQNFNSWKVGKKLHIERKPRETASPQQSKGKTSELEAYSRAIQNTVYSMGGKDLQSFAQRGMPGVPECVQIDIYNSWYRFMTQKLKSVKMAQRAKIIEECKKSIIASGAMKYSWLEMKLDEYQRHCERRLQQSTL